MCSFAARIVAAGRLRAALRPRPLAAMVLAALALWALPAQALDPKDRGAVGDAFRAAAASDWERAFRILEPVRAPLAAKTLRYLRLVEGAGGESFAEIARFLLANPHWPVPARVQVLAEERIGDPADHDLIRRFFAERPPRTVRGHVRYAESLLDAGDEDAAEALIRRVWVEGDFSASETSKFLERHGRHLRPEDHIARLDNLVWDYRRSSATRMLDLVPAGHRRLAEARLRLQRRQAGVDGAIAAVPGNLRNDPGLVFDRLRWRRQKRRHDDAIELLLDPPAELERAGMWWFEREFQLRRALRARDFDLAHRLADSHRQSEGVDFAEAEWLAGWLALRFADQPRTALRRFESLHDGVERPISLARAAYWAGRAAAALGDDETAGQWYRRAARHHITFYGQRAADELGRSPRPPVELPATVAQRRAFEGRELVRVARMLLESGATDALRPFLLRLVDDAESPVEIGLIAGLAAAAERPDLVAVTGKYATYDDLVHDAAAFPIPDLPAVLDPPEGYPDPALVLAVARQESLFNSFAMSHAGARGLLQLMPATASMMARALELPYNRGLLTGDPDYNARLGGYYLKTMLERYDGEPALALAAYNAGPRRVDAWLRLHGDPRGKGAHALIDWIELIPFDETRNYVQRVLENHGVYRSRLLGARPGLVAMREINGPLDPAPLPVARPGGIAPATRVAGLEPVPDPVLKPDPVEVVPAGFAEAAEGGLERPPRPALKPAPVTRLSRAEPAAKPDG